MENKQEVKREIYVKPEMKPIESVDVITLASIGLTGSDSRRTGAAARVGGGPTLRGMVSRTLVWITRTHLNP